MRHFSIFLLILLVFSACTIQKRTVNKGYFVQWHFQKKVQNDALNERDKVAISSEENMEDNYKDNEINLYSEIILSDTFNETRTKEHDLLRSPEFDDATEKSNTIEVNQALKYSKEDSLTREKRNEPYRYVFQALPFCIFLMVLSLLCFVCLFFVHDVLFLVLLCAGFFFLGAAAIVLFLELTVGISSKF